MSEPDHKARAAEAAIKLEDVERHLREAASGSAPFPCNSHIAEALRLAMEAQDILHGGL